MQDKKEITMSKKINKIKKHFTKHKTKYIITGVVVISVAGTIVVMRKLNHNEIEKAVTEAVKDVVKETEKAPWPYPTRGPQRKLMNIDTKEIFASVREGAESIEASAEGLRKAVNGGYSYKGYTFQYVDETFIENIVTKMETTRSLKTDYLPVI